MLLIKNINLMFIIFKVDLTDKKRGMISHSPCQLLDKYDIYLTINCFTDLPSAVLIIRR